MLKQERESIFDFLESVIIHIFNHYGETVKVDVNWRKEAGVIGYGEAAIGGKQLIRIFQWGLQLRKTIHKTVPELQDRHPNGYEGLYWYALNTAAAIMIVNDNKQGRSTIPVKLTAAEVHRLSIRFSFDEIMRLYFDAARAVRVQTVIDVPARRDPDWNVYEWEAVQVYLQGIVEMLADMFGLADGTVVEFKNTDQAKHKRHYRGAAHYILFGKKRIKSYFYQGDPEYARTIPYFRDFFNGETRRGIDALYWIACHEFAHALQTEREEIEGIEYSLGGKRIIHGRIFREELRRVVDAFPFRNSLKLILPETETEIRNLLK